MSYHMYTTEALVCGVAEQHQSDCSYLLFTKDLGMIWASARSVREERSRQRYALQLFSVITISLLRGKSGWKIGSVISLQNYYHCTKNRDERNAVVRLFKVVRQYIHGEEANESLFKELQQGCQLICESNQKNVEHIAIMYTVRMLRLLGYVDVTPEMVNKLSDPVNTILDGEDVVLLNAIIKNASSVSHL
jgi:DNA repair protein RecO